MQNPNLFDAVPASTKVASSQHQNLIADAWKAITEGLASPCGGCDTVVRSPFWFFSEEMFEMFPRRFGWHIEMIRSYFCQLFDLEYCRLKEAEVQTCLASVVPIFSLSELELSRK